MKPEDAPPRPRAAMTPVPADARLQAWLELREQLRLLEAQLETVRLMLRLQGKAR
jgi:hypothetical protein